jgi:hypothetical protein
LSGIYLQEHKTDIINLAHNEESAEKGEHPLHRIMAGEERADQIFMTTTSWTWASAEIIIAGSPTIALRHSTRDLGSALLDRRYPPAANR